MPQLASAENFTNTRTTPVGRLEVNSGAAGELVSSIYGRNNHRLDRVLPLIAWSSIALLIFFPAI